MFGGRELANSIERFLQVQHGIRHFHPMPQSGRLCRRFTMQRRVVSHSCFIPLAMKTLFAHPVKADTTSLVLNASSVILCQG